MTRRSRGRSATAPRVAAATIVAAIVASACLAAIATPAGVPTVDAQAPSDGYDAEDADEPGSLMLIMDASGSMKKDAGGGSRLAASKQALMELVRSLPVEASVGLRVLGGRAIPSRRRACRQTDAVVPLAPPDRGLVEERIRSYGAGGATPIARALRQAAGDLPRKGRRTIVLVSDGKDTCQPPPPCEIARRISRRGVDLAVEAIGFQLQERAARRQLRCIAAASGGTYRDADDADELAAELRAVSARALRVYHPQGRPVDGGASPAGATPIAPGQYVDDIGPDEERWYTVQAASGQVIFAAATLPPIRGTPFGGVGAVFAIELLDPTLNPTRSRRDAAPNVSVGSYRSGAIESVGITTPVIGGKDAPEGFERPGEYHLSVSLDDPAGSPLAEALGTTRPAYELVVGSLDGGGEVRAPGAGSVEGEGASAEPAAASSDDASDGVGVAPLAVGGLFGLGGARPWSQHRRQAAGTEVARAMKRWRTSRSGWARTTLVAVVGLALNAAVPAEAAEQSEPIVGGGSFNTAPLVEPGRYSDTILARETLFYRVRLGEGEALGFAGAVGGLSEQVLARALGPTGSGATGAGSPLLYLTVDLYTPMRQNMAARDLATGDARDRKVVEAEVPAVQPARDAIATASRLGTSDYEGPGEYYVVLSMLDPLSGEERERRLELPLDLTVEVSGGGPQRTGEPGTDELPGAAADAEASGGEQAGSERDTEDGSALDQIALVGALGLVGGGLVGTAGAALLGRRRKGD